MALTNARQVKAQVEKLRKELNSAVSKAEKQRKVAQDSLGGLVGRARQLLSSLGNSRIARLLEGKKATPAQKAVNQIRGAAKSAQKSAGKAATSARKNVNTAVAKARSSASKVEKRVGKSAQKAATDVRKSVSKAQKTVKSAVPKVAGNAKRLIPKSVASMSRAAMATSKAKASMPAPAAPAEAGSN